MELRLGGVQRPRSALRGVRRQRGCALEESRAGGEASAAQRPFSGALQFISDVVKNYPDNPLSGNSYYYQAEIDYRGGRYADAIKAYDSVLQQYPDSNKVPVAHLHKGMALVALNQKDAGVREFRTLSGDRLPNHAAYGQRTARQLRCIPGGTRSA